jgi:hypothetical protein
MELELVFASELNSEDDILFGIESQEAVHELAKFYETDYNTLVAGNVNIEMPSQAKAKSLDPKSVELKNLFKNYPDKMLRILDPDPKSYKNPSRTLRLP